MLSLYFKNLAGKKGGFHEPSKVLVGRSVVCSFVTAEIILADAAAHWLRCLISVCLIKCQVPSFNPFLSLVSVFLSHPDRRLRPADMGEVGGAARNKGASVSQHSRRQTLSCVRFYFSMWRFFPFCLSPITPPFEPFCLSPRSPVCVFSFFFLTLSSSPLAVWPPPLFVSTPPSPCVFSLLSAVYHSGEYTAVDGDGCRVTPPNPQPPPPVPLPPFPPQSHVCSPRTI